MDTHRQIHFKGTTIPSGAGGAASSASSLDLDGTASPAASLLASEAAAFGAYLTVIANTSTKRTRGLLYCTPLWFDWTVEWRFFLGGGYARRRRKRSSGETSAGLWGG
jgi:hypothetical protein